MARAAPAEAVVLVVRPVEVVSSHAPFLSGSAARCVGLSTGDAPGDDRYPQASTAIGARTGSSAGLGAGQQPELLGGTDFLEGAGDQLHVRNRPTAA